MSSWAKWFRKDASWYRSMPGQSTLMGAEAQAKVKAKVRKHRELLLQSFEGAAQSIFPSDGRLVAEHPSRLVDRCEGVAYVAATRTHMLAFHFVTDELFDDLDEVE